jgi:hypothetical protein
MITDSWSSRGRSVPDLELLVRLLDDDDRGVDERADAMAMPPSDMMFGAEAHRAERDERDQHRDRIVTIGIIALGCARGTA